MSELSSMLETHDPDARREYIVNTLVDTFSELMENKPAAFRTKFRKMAASPFAFYRGTACLFYSDVARLKDPWADERTSRVWIQGDLHAENFGTYMDGEGVLIFDVNDFDEAYLGHFTWDLQRFAASLALLGWSKALPDEDIGEFIRRATRSYIDQVRQFVAGDDDAAFSLNLGTTDGPIREVLQQARLRSRGGLLDRETETEGYDRKFRNGVGVRRLGDDEYQRVIEAFQRYLSTIPQDKKMRDIAYQVKDVVGRSGFGIGSAGLPAYSVLIEGENEALENDLILSVKQGNAAAPATVVPDERIRNYFLHHGQRTAMSQRALQAHADALLGYTEIDGTGYVVSEVSPYVSDLDWGELTEPDDIRPVVDYLGRAIAKIHCVADSDSDQTLVPFQTEDAISKVLEGREEEFADWLCDFAMSYADVVRDDYRLFVEAFRNGEIGGVTSTRT
ncbi:uncharacterized protein (DUF2252 family) [Actinopolyspora lacussalsi]|uniref:Uncharacterized conserved protein, DUF2252 family n=1 Tax=Actinopolyspora righensis TaxID=995060 RepID=A0A1I7BBT9_9ACTN|nr:DUF2252 domain-containing protein [Actinopolyspora righensis]MDP9642295.1 uncharacterized protein (DUF2252 family) [Actinopolyspora lacussalsi]SFT84669.1 Uncharacterized conserved protein, DUF2252 family [Actinopolyspora righensis]